MEERHVINLSLFSQASSLSLILCKPSYATETPPPAGTCITTSNPSTTVQFCRQLGLENGRLRGCQANENCLSTSDDESQLDKIANSKFSSKVNDA